MYLWEWYWEMRSRDRDGMPGAPRALSNADMYYWQEVTGMKLTERERALLHRLDRLYLSMLGDAQGRAKAKAENRRGR